MFFPGMKSQDLPTCTRKGRTAMVRPSFVFNFTLYKLYNFLLILGTRIGCWRIVRRQIYFIIFRIYLRLRNV